MKIIKYSDPYADAPYGTAMDIILPDDTPADVIEEVQQFLDEDYLYIKNDERKHRRHKLDGISFVSLHFVAFTFSESRICWLFRIFRDHPRSAETFQSGNASPLTELMNTAFRNTSLVGRFTS